MKSLRSVDSPGRHSRRGLPPVSAPDARVLVLGSMPGVRSLELKQYYAHPRNAFWSVMAELFGFDPRASYEDRLQALIRNRIALWDVLAGCERPGSLDAAIRMRDAQVNDFASFFEAHPAIEVVAFNGVKAAEMYRNRVGPDVGRGGGVLRLETMPSTSPANAAAGYSAKLAAWGRLVLRP